MATRWQRILNSIGGRAIGATGAALKSASRFMFHGTKVSGGVISGVGIARNIIDDMALGWKSGGMLSTGGSKIIGAAAIGYGAAAAASLVHQGFTRMSGGVNGPEYVGKNPQLTDTSYRQTELLRQQREFEASAAGLSLSLHSIKGRVVDAVHGLRRS